ncbi:MAG: hypothetical protein Ct9H300mP1_17270 [Planctomycetaceae bacterium]|nr:MAG: hypothetical protein Ct9H300mP1_17270 [Planctomycetaceae bacterium]
MVCFFGPATGLAVTWTRWATRQGSADPVRRSAAYSAAFVIGWQMSVFVSDAMAWHVVTTQLARGGTVLLFLVGLMWVVYGVEMASQFYARLRRSSGTRWTGLPISGACWDHSPCGHCCFLRE